MLMLDDSLLTKESLEREYRERMKEQERQAIRAIIAVRTLLIIAKGVELSKKLDDTVSEMQEYTSNTFVNNIKGGFEGKAAEATETYLTQTMKKPDLKSPIKS
ncbi:hypothetical protein [Streptococcus parasanguinis]|uniref:hypothetical protein n=1 Tax=Streptococcus parasanguinis TaxID=1318 RepID=UPI003219AA6E